jgi:putative FmdB family regulatory protein
MPTYVYRCESCGDSFEQVMPISGQREPVHCPKCNSDRVAWTPAPFVAITGKKS